MTPWRGCISVVLTAASRADRPARVSRRSIHHQASHALQALHNNPAVPAAPPAPQAAPGPAAIVVEDIDDDGPDEGDLHHVILEAGIEPDDNGNLDLSKAASLLNTIADEDGEPVEDDAADIDVGDASAPSSAAAAPAVPAAKPIPVRRSTRIAKGLEALVSYVNRDDV